MKKILFALILLVLSNTMYAQELTKTYGKVGLGEVQYQKCSFDSSATAVVMFDWGSSSFIDDDNGSFAVVYERKTRIKVLSDAGIKWGEIAVPYYDSNNIYEKIYDVEASSYNFENGQMNISTLKLNNCHTEKLNENWQLYKFAIPNVKKGSIIEYAYKIESPYLFNLRNWEFQWEIPVLISQYIVKMVPFYQYSYILQGASSFDQFSEETGDYEHQYGSAKYKEKIYVFGMDSVPAFNDEKFITSKSDNILKLDFQLSKVLYPNGMTKDVITTWPKLIDDLQEDDNVGKYIQKSKSIAPKILTLTAFSTLNEQQKFDSILNLVKQNFKWNEKFSKYSSKNPKDLIKDKFGNSTDLNLFTIGLLNAVGIDAYPVLMSTRDHGKIKYDYPFLDFFNNNLIVAKVDGKYVMTDATDIMVANNRIPEECINDQGLILHKNKVEWIKLQTKQPTMIRTNVIQDFTNDADNTQLVMNATEYAGLSMRKHFGTDIKSIQKKLVEDNYQVEDSNIVVKNQFSFKLPYSVSIRFHNNADVINNKLYISPFLNEVIKNNPLKQKSRTYPIDMIYPEYRSYVASIKIPAGYKVDYMPAETQIDNDKFELRYSTALTENTITISLSYYFKESEYPAADYADIKFYFNEIVDKGSDKVVLVKI